MRPSSSVRTDKELLTILEGRMLALLEVILSRRSSSIWLS